MVKISLLLLALVGFWFVVHGSIAAKDHDIGPDKRFGQGQNDDKKIGIYELKKGNMSLKFTNWGASIISVFLPDKDGKIDDVVLGYDSVDDYKNDTVYFGAIVGRVANRIRGARFKLNGIVYKVFANEGKNMLHGGKIGFSDVVWNVKKHKKEGRTPYIVFEYDSFDGEEGFHGKLHVKVTYSLSGDNELTVKMKAKAEDKATPVNLAQHTYWNLGGHTSGDILSEEIKIFASNYTPVDGDLIPTGEIVTVKGTPFDFLNSQAISDNINKLSKGYDINYALDGSEGKDMKVAAIVIDKKSGRKMELTTNAPGVQFYTANMLKEVKGKGGFVYRAHAALCLETQHFPDSVNHPNFPSTIIAPGKIYKHKMVYKFSISS